MRFYNIFSVKFTFRRSKRSNNGTDVSAGQIPELLYSIPSLAPLNEVEVTAKPKNISLVQTLSKHFCLSFKEVSCVLIKVLIVLRQNQKNPVRNLLKASSEFWNFEQLHCAG